MKKMSVFVCFMVGLVLSSPSIYAQVSTGTIAGTVRDATGAVLPGVEVTVLHVDTGLSRLLITGDEGRYRAPELAVGNYEVRAELIGFQTAVRTGLGLTVGREALVDLTLEVGEISEEVVVTGEAPLINTTSSALSDLIDEQQVHDLPLNSRNLVELSLLSPGVTQTRTASYTGQTTSPAGVKISMGGARIYMTGYLLDGVDITDSSRSSGVGGAAGSLFGVETVREFQVITNNFSAQYSRFAGGVISLVTKSGTNRFHGSVFEFHRNDNLDARNFFDVDPSNPTERSDPPEFKRHQFGATIGGPIVEDRSFFFGSFEGFRQSRGLSFNTGTPTAEARQGILPGKTVTVNPASQPFIDLYPLPNGPDRGNGIGEYFVTGNEPTNEIFASVRIDHTFSDSDSLFGRYTVTDGDRALQAALPGDGWLSDSFATYVTLEEKHIFSPNLINTLRMGFQRTTWSQQAPPGLPDLNIGLIPGEPMGQILMAPAIGISSTGVWIRGKNVTNMFSYTDDIFMTKGRHDLKMGASFVRHQNNDFFNGFFGGRYQFNSLEDFLIGRPFSWLGALPGSSSLRGFREWVIGFYLQDDFKLSPNLTLNLGVRYEAITQPYEINGKVGNLRDPNNDAEPTLGEPLFKNPSKRNFAPRIGLAWDPFGDGKTSIRSGFGIFHDTVLFYHYANQGRRQFPLNQTEFIVFPSFPVPTPRGRGSRSMQTAEFEPHQPYMMQWNLTLQRELLPETTFTVSYVGSRGVNLLGHRNVNNAEPSSIINGKKFFEAGLSRRNPNFTDIIYWDYANDSWYHGLQMSVRKRFSEGLQFQASYTWGRSIDTISRTNSGDIQGTGLEPQDGYDVKASNRGLSDHHVGHMFSFNYAYKLPITGLSGAAKAIAEGWQLQGIIRLSTGNPQHFTLGSLGDWNRDLDTGRERPSLVPGRSPNPIRADGRDPTQYFDPTAIQLQPRGFYGDLGRNTLTAPGVATFDFSLIKAISLSEDTDLQFRAEFFNIFNRANFGLPSMSIFSAATTDAVGNVLSSTYSPTAGRITDTKTSSRQIQLGLRLVF